MKQSRKLEHSQIEKVLIPRLRFISFVLIGFGFASFAYGFFSLDAPEISPDAFQEIDTELVAEGLEEPKDSLFMLTPQERLIFFGIGAAFLVVGAVSFVAAWKKHQFHHGHRQK